MTWHQHDISEKSNELYYTDAHVELSCVFTSAGGDSVEVTSPSVTFTPNTPTNVLQPLSLDHDVQPPPKYTIKFLTKDMAAGDYDVDFTGSYNGDNLSTSGTFSLYTITNEQDLINTLRSLLKDTMPQLYLVHLPDADTFRWRDGELYSCITQALQAMNNTPPVTITFTLDNMPFTGFLINIAMMYALHQRGMLEIANAINYSDEISFSIDRDSKYTSKAQMFSQLWWLEWVKVKKDYAFHQIQHQAVISCRFPLHAIRPLSMLPHSANTFGYY